MFAVRDHPSSPPEPYEKKNIPSNLLDKVTDEGSALAKVTLGAANAGLGDAGGGLLCSGKNGID